MAGHADAFHAPPHTSPVTGWSDKVLAGHET